ncbi:Intraflagellar transport protein IFT57 [Giardia muris]|uniref:Intraflagellar transport protein IFT57 n=1 Tax=Giardia muris TaxID=5742 RepID=A0A4Z1SRN6_GIAMU|nr:Intraflagellar transport protein IFT57 [Giardia muris]|eukprot:TNJ28400.1 Intraflagellar transport protein IFT57 [Giardia muris]
MAIEPRLNMPAVVNSHYIVARLRQLRYEERYCAPAGLPCLLPAHFYLESPSPLDQLVQTVRLAQWLLSLLGIQTQAVSEFDEPTAVATDLVTACRDVVNVERIPPHKIKQGYGDGITALILALCDACLQKLQPALLSWKSLGSEEAAVEREEEEQQQLQDDLFEEFISTPSLASNAVTGSNTQRPFPAIREGDAIAPGVSNPQNWATEVAEATAQLASRDAHLASQDWRRDITSMSSLAKALGRDTVQCSQSLTGLASGIAKQLERIASREQHLSGQLAQYSGQLTEVSMAYKTVAAEEAELEQTLAELTEELATVSERLRALKTELQVESTRISDTSSIHEVKGAITTMAGELRRLDLQITLAQQRLFAVTAPMTSSMMH